MSPASYLTAPPRGAGSIVANHAWICSGARVASDDALLARARTRPARHGGLDRLRRAEGDRALPRIEAALARDRRGARRDLALERADRVAPPGGGGERHSAQ